MNSGPFSLLTNLSENDLVEDIFTENDYEELFGGWWEDAVEEDDARETFKVIPTIYKATRNGDCVGAKHEEMDASCETFEVINTGRNLPYFKYRVKNFYLDQISYLTCF